MFDLVPSVLATDLLENRLRLRWSKPNCDPENVYCKHKSTKISRIVVAAAGVISSLSLSLFSSLHLVMGFFFLISGICLLFTV